MLSQCCFILIATEQNRTHSQILSSFAVKECLLSLTLSQQFCNVSGCSGGHYTKIQHEKIFGHSWQTLWGSPTFPMYFLLCTYGIPSLEAPYQPSQPCFFTYKKYFFLDGLASMNMIAGLKVTPSIYVCFEKLFRNSAESHFMLKFLSISQKVVQVSTWPVLPFLYRFVISFLLTFTKDNE